MGCLGHIIFCILHVLAFFLGFVGLFVTIPLHLIFIALRSNGKKLRKLERSAG